MLALQTRGTTLAVWSAPACKGGVLSARNPNSHAPSPSTVARSEGHDGMVDES